MSQLAQNREARPRPDASQPDILMIGNDPALLSYREQVLEWAGWRVCSVAPKAVTKQWLCGGAHLCVLCHTLSPEQRESLVDLIRKEASQLRILAITAGDINQREAIRFDGLLENLDGPARLIEEVRCQLSAA